MGGRGGAGGGPGHPPLLPWPGWGRKPDMFLPTENTVVQSIKLQGNRGGTGKSRQNTRGNGIAKLVGAVPLMEAPL